MNKIIKDLSKYSVYQLSSALAIALAKVEDEKNGIRRCKWCDDVLRHDDDSSTECRFCNASPRNSDGSPKVENEETAQNCVA
jgi:hypothetical protein